MTFCILADGKCRLWQRGEKENRGPQHYYSSSVSGWHANNIILQVWAKQAAKVQTSSSRVAIRPVMGAPSSG
eukprot:scaffold374704_cov18-Prasinocladus_malaysianus.AAC.1